MQWKDVTNFIGDAAPMIGYLLGGPAGSEIGTLVASALGVENKEEAILEAIKNNPQALIKLKELELKHKEELEALTIEKAKIVLKEKQMYLQDTQNARNREATIVQATGKKDYNLYILGWTIVSGFIGLIILLNFHVLPDDTTGVIFMLFGALSAAFGQVIQYFFGSSESSQQKTKLLASYKNKSQIKE